VRGSPIRTSSDQRSVGSSPRLIAASYVLHRLLVPRHPPCALNNLATQLQQTPHPTGCGPCNQRRCSRPLCSSQRTTGHPPAPPPPTPPRARQPAAHRQVSGTRTRTAPTRDNQPPTARTHVHPARGPLPQDPTACLRPRPPPAPFPTPPPNRETGGTGSRQQPAAELVSVPPSSTTPGTSGPPQRGTVTPWARLCTTHPLRGRRRDAP
jgi:hypothetical protein